MKIWIKAICLTSFVLQMAACSNSTQINNESRPAQAVQNGIQQHMEGKVLLMFQKLIRKNKRLRDC